MCRRLSLITIIKIIWHYFIFSYDVVFTEDEKEILKKYDALNATILFSAEDFCWPDKSLAVSSFSYINFVSFTEEN